MEEEEQEESPLVRRTMAKIAIEGSSPSGEGDVTLEISTRGSYIGIVARQGEGDEEDALEMVLSQSDFQGFLALAHTLLGVAVEQEL